MVDNDIIEPSNSEWSSPCILVPKPDGSYRFIMDFWKVNAVTKTDSFPIPRIDDCINSKAKYVCKFDLMKGYWQVPLTDRAKESSAFVTPDGLYQHKVIPFGMKNAPAIFQRMMHSFLHRIQGCDVYIDDVIIYNTTWKEHLHIINDFFLSTWKRKPIGEPKQTWILTCKGRLSIYMDLHYSRCWDTYYRSRFPRTLQFACRTVILYAYQYAHRYTTTRIFIQAFHNWTNCSDT